MLQVDHHLLVEPVVLLDDVGEEATELSVTGDI
jgi:hypothetical protein